MPPSRSWRRRSWWVVATLVALYVGSYLALSLGGRYEPAIISLNYVMRYDWAPTGFVREYRWNDKLIHAYAPLYLIDVRCWHTFDRARSGMYPIHEVEGEDAVWDVYRAWKREK